MAPILENKRGLDHCHATAEHVGNMRLCDVHTAVTSLTVQESLQSSKSRDHPHVTKRWRQWLMIFTGIKQMLRIIVPLEEECSTFKVIETEMVLRCPRSDLIKLAEDSIIRLFNAALNRTGGETDSTTLADAVYAILNDIETCDGVEVSEIEQHCVRIIMKCKTCKSLLELLEYIESKRLQQRLQGLSSALGEMYDNRFSITTKISEGSLEGLLKMRKRVRGILHQLDELPTGLNQIPVANTSDVTCLEKLSEYTEVETEDVPRQELLDISVPGAVSKHGVQALQWKTGTLDLNGDLEEALKAILEKVSPFFEKDNGLLSRLRASMDCQTEMAEGDIRSLMEAVAPGLMVDYTNSNLSAANFIYSVIEFLKDSKKVKKELDGEANGLTRRCFEADILLIHAEDDIELATGIEESIKRNDVSVKLDGDVGIGQPRLTRLGDVFKQYIYVFILVNDKLKDDVLAAFSAEMLLVNSLFNAKGRVIPVQATGRNTRYIVDKYPVYGTLHPWNYGMGRSNEQLESLIQNANKALFEITNSN